MSAGLTFDHCYQKTTEAADYERFESLGFTLLAGSADHPFSLYSRILFFGSPEVSINGPTRCIEFCRIRDVKGKLAYARKSNPEATERDLFKPGLSLGSATSLEACVEKNKAEWADLRPSLSHRNYDWTAGGDDRRPGWNFLQFDTPVVPGVVVWGTDYEPSPARAERRLEWLGQPPHRNGVTDIVGFVFDLSDTEKRTLSKLTEAVWHDGVLTMQDGMKIFAERERPEFIGRFPSKPSPFKAVIMKCRSLARFCEVSGLQPEEGLGMARISSSQPESWDILIAERPPA